MAAIGSAVGLGNIWRFPYICYQNGGGAFLIPYFVALFTAGIPLLIIEFGIGHLYGKAAPFSFKKVGKKWEWVGWWATLVAFFIVTYYAVVMAWCLTYLFHSINLLWGTDASSFFFDQFLAKTPGPGILGGIRPQIFWALIFVWTSVFLILYKGVRSIGRVVAITVPLPTILLIILAIRGLTLPGAMDGLAFYLTPDFSKLTSATVWLAAYAQIFFTLSLAQGIMIVYASYLKKKSDITNNAFIVSLANGGTSFLAGFAVFSVLGYLAHSTGVGVGEVIEGGVGLAFVTYPTAISLLPFGAAFFGLIFFLALLTFGIDSSFSMVEPFPSAVKDKWGISKDKATALICIAGFLLGLIYTTGGGIHWLSIADHFLSNFGLVLIGLAECIIFGYFLGTEKIREHINEVSDIKIGRWWDLLIKIVVPMALLSIIAFSIIEIFSEGYNNYPRWALFIGGAFLVILAVFFSFIFMKIKEGKNASK